eukprot:197456_1
MADLPLLGDMNNKQQTIVKYCCACTCVIGILLAIILIPISIHQVEHDEYAIRYDDFTNTIYDNVYTEGKYLLTPQTRLFRFSNLVKKLEIELPCLTSNAKEYYEDRLQVQTT